MEFVKDLCEKNSGYLFSVDVVDCSKVSNNKRWKFIQSRDDNFDYIKSLIPKKIDVIYIDTLHEAAHVKKIIYGYYEMLNEGGFIFIDDISHLPYLKTTMGNNFYCEINNKETFEIILEIYETNKDIFLHVSEAISLIYRFFFRFTKYSTFLLFFRSEYGGKNKKYTFRQTTILFGMIYSCNAQCGTPYCETHKQIFA